MRFQRPSAMYESEMVFIEDTPVADYLESTSEVEVTQPNPHVPAPNVSSKQHNVSTLNENYILFNAGKSNWLPYVHFCTLCGSAQLGMKARN